jgi:hypothetical protein
MNRFLINRRLSNRTEFDRMFNRTVRVTIRLHKLSKLEIQLEYASTNSFS